MVQLETKPKQSKTKNPQLRNKDKLLLGQLLCIALGKTEASVDFVIFVSQFQQRHLGGNYGHFYFEEVSFSNFSTHMSFSQSLRIPFCFLCARGEFSNQLCSTVGRRMVRQIKQLLIPQVRKRIQAWKDQFISLLGILIITIMVALHPRSAQTQSNSSVFGFSFHSATGNRGEAGPPAGAWSPLSTAVLGMSTAERQWSCICHALTFSAKAPFRKNHQASHLCYFFFDSCGIKKRAFIQFFMAAQGSIWKSVRTVSSKTCL